MNQNLLGRVWSYSECALAAAATAAAASRSSGGGATAALTAAAARRFQLLLLFLLTFAFVPFDNITIVGTNERVKGK